MESKYNSNPKEIRQTKRWSWIETLQDGAKATGAYGQQIKSFKVDKSVGIEESKQPEKIKDQIPQQGGF